jgi:hypothetical protein
MSPPTDLCPSHADVWRKWARYEYNPRRNHDWGSIQLLDSRTPIEQRRADWNRKNRDQLALVERVCRSGCAAPVGGPETVSV